MDILKQFDGKINGTLETFDRIIINGLSYTSLVFGLQDW